MSAIRLPLLCAFAGGCLSNIVLFGLWRAADGDASSPLKQAHRSHAAVHLAATANEPSVDQPTVLAAVNAPARARADAPAPEAADTVAAPPAGSAVSDVLMGLEAAYREHAATRSAPLASLAPEHAAAAEPTVNVPAQPVAEVAPVIPPAPSEPPPAAAAPVALAVAPVTAPPVVVAPAAPVAVAAQDAAVPTYAPPDAPPSVVHYGDVNQNTYVTNIHQGDVYQVQVQQLALLQYMQLMGMSPAASAPARHVGGTARVAAPRQRITQFPSGITNPDNPWGFNFAPPNLVR